MAMFRRMMNSLRRHGIGVTLFKLHIVLVDHWFDIRYRTDTCSWALLEDLDIKSDNRNRGVRYEPARVVLLRRMFTAMRPMIAPDSVVVDLGAGKGRVLLVASQFGYKAARGVEFAPELCQIARDNCARYVRATGTSTEFQIVESDVVDYAINADENVFVMFNPFDDVVLNRVLDNIDASLERNPRRIFIGYYSPAFSETIARHSNLVSVMDVHYRGYRFAVYSNEE
jgi:SAM-dependent methyltransferase